MKHQFFPLEIKGKFYLTQPKQKTPSPIVFVVRVGGRQLKFHLGVKVYPDQWSASKQCAYISPILSNVDNTNNEIVNEKVNEFKFRFSEYKEYICNKGEGLDLVTQLKSTIMGKPRKKKSDNIEDIVGVIRRAVINDTTIRDTTSKNYRNKGLPALQFYLDYLEREKGEKIEDFHLFTTEFFNAFSSHILNKYHQPSGKPYSIPTINSILKYAKSAIVLAARAGGYLTELEIDAIKLRQYDDKSSDNGIALRNDEIMAIYRYKCKNKQDEIVRDMFLLECTLGHRVSDILYIDKRVDSIGDKYYITVPPEKTPNKKIEVGLIFEIAKEILIDKYQCKLPKCSKESINRNIKRIAEDAGVIGEELQSVHQAGQSKPTEYKKERCKCIVSHTGRRTFVSLLSARGWTYEAISKYTGQSLDMVAHYDKATAKYTDIYKDTLENRPKDIVRLISDTKESTVITNITNSDNQLNSIIELSRESERQKITIEQLTQTITESEKRLQLLDHTVKESEQQKITIEQLSHTITENKKRLQLINHSTEIEKQIEALQGKSEKEKAELLEMLMKMGFTYDDYLKLQKERYEMEHDIEIADSLHDTFLDE